MADIIIVGQNPSAKAPRKGSTRSRLKEWTDEMQMGPYDFMNVVNKSGKPDKSMIDYKLLTFNLKDYRRVIALGNFASNALNKIGVAHFKLPHPSPRNRMINHPEKISAILADCAKYVA